MEDRQDAPNLLGTVRPEDVEVRDIGRRSLLAEIEAYPRSGRR